MVYFRKWEVGMNVFICTLPTDGEMMKFCIFFGGGSALPPPTLTMYREEDEVGRRCLII
jgi:hypothetical protein